MIGDCAPPSLAKKQILIKRKADSRIAPLSVLACFGLYAVAGDMAFVGFMGARVEMACL